MSRFIPISAFFAIFALALGPTDLNAQAPGDEKKTRKPPAQVSKEKAASPLTPTERERIRKVLAEAWERPDVIAARDEVHMATENYKRALNEAVAKIDPGAEELMNRLHKGSKMEAMRHRLPPHRKGPNGHGPVSSPEELVERLASSEPAFRTMSFDERRRFLEIARKVHESGAIDDELRKALEKSGKSDSHLAARKRTRKALLDAMMREDPWVKKAIAAGPKRTPRP